MYFTFKLELIIWHMERRSSQIEELNSIPLYPTEEVIWDENLGIFFQTIFYFIYSFIETLELNVI